MIKFLYSILFFLIAIPSDSLAQTVIKVPMIDRTGKEIGTAELSSLSRRNTLKGVRVQLDLHGLRPGEHALHFHEFARCATPDFRSAGDHFAKKGQVHGHIAADANPNDKHWGDLRNVTADRDGNIATAVVADEVTLRRGEPNSLLTNGGTALILHAKPDDYRSQPSGAAGDRIACAEIRPSKNDK